jgi:hypothetical protein
MRELRESVIQVALDNMMSRQEEMQNNDSEPGSPAPGLGESMVDAADQPETTKAQRYTLQSGNVHSLREVPLNVHATSATRASAACSQSEVCNQLLGKDIAQDEDELIRLQPEAWEECDNLDDDLDDMMAVA